MNRAFNFSLDAFFLATSKASQLNAIVMLSRDKVEGLHNYHEFSQPLECLYQDMQTQEKRFLLLLENNFPEKKGQNSLVQSTD